MPEGDTLFRAAAALHDALAGHIVTGFESSLAGLAAGHDDSPVTGRTVERCESVGKHLLVHFSGGLTLRTHMRMSGSWHLYRPGERWRRSRQAMRVRIDTASWVAVAFDVPVAEFIDTANLARHPILSALGPDLLSPELDGEAAAERLAAGGARPIAEVLLDQRIVAGIGNIFKSEVLFVCRVHPDTPASSLERTTRARLIETAVRLMRANTGASAGGPIRTYRSLRSARGAASSAESVWVYGRAGKPCRRCGTAIRSARRPPDARTTYWCPTCQVEGAL